MPQQDITNETRQAKIEKLKNRKTNDGFPVKSSLVNDFPEPAISADYVWTPEETPGNVSRETHPRIPTEGVDQLADEMVGEFDSLPTEEDEASKYVNELFDFVEGAAKHRNLPDIAPSQGMTIVEGFIITPDMSPDEAEELLENIQTYIGVMPRAIDQYCGRWLKMLGCVLMPITADVDALDSAGRKVINHETGEVVQRVLSWTAPLFKIDAKDDITGMNIILTGGGKYGELFARAMTAIRHPGDWKKPKMVFITQESRPQGPNEPPHRMYRFAFKKVEEGK